MSEIRYYAKDGAPIEDMWEWARLHDDREYCVIQQDSIPYGDGTVDVSTVWLGLDHNFWGGLPLIFETMVFGGPMDEEQHRYSTEEEARIGHAGVVEMVSLKLMMQNRKEKEVPDEDDVEWPKRKLL